MRRVGQGPGHWMGRGGAKDGVAFHLLSKANRVFTAHHTLINPEGSQP